MADTFLQSQSVFLNKLRPLRTSARLLAPAIVFCAVVFNFVLCFVDSNIFGISERTVIFCEIALIAAAFGLVWYSASTLYLILLGVSAYFFTVMVFRANFDAKIIHDVLLPFAFFFLGSRLGSTRSADRLVFILIVAVLATSLFEWFELHTYLRVFNVMHYYVSRGTETDLQQDAANHVFINDPSSGNGLFVNATRFNERTLLPFLGDHRSSGLFLEPVSVGNFCAIAFAWLILRARHRFAPFITATISIMVILVLADARFGFYLCLLTPIVYLIAPIVRPTALFLAPFVTMLALVLNAGPEWERVFSNNIAGRFLHAGDALASLGPLEVLGLRVSDDFESLYAGDVGYGYALVQIGLVGVLALWALFAYCPAPNRDAARFKSFVVLYTCGLLAISASFFSIKTAALLWFLHGTLSNPDRIVPIAGNEKADPNLVRRRGARDD